MTIDADGTFDDPPSPWASDLHREVLTPDPPSAVEFATAGWEDAAEVADMGDGSTGPDGVTLIRVTMHSGYATGQPTSPTGAANGHRRLVQPMGPNWYIPAKGQRCVVAFPAGPQSPGSGVILGYPGVSPGKQYRPGGASQNYGDQDLVITAKSITLRDAANNLLSISPDGGAQIVTATGSSIVAHEGIILIRVLDEQGTLRTTIALDGDTIQIVNAAGGSGLKLASPDVSVTGGNVSLNALGAVSLGANASPATRVVVSPGPAAAGVGSQSIYGSP